MNSPISNFELGKMTHREYEAEASRYWRQSVTDEEKQSGRMKGAKLAMALGGLSAMVLVLVQLLPF